MGLAGLQENVFAGQSKIYSFMSPNKCSGMRSPFRKRIQMHTTKSNVKGNH
jgi:histone-lysine N-methyltransferase SETD8